MPSGNYLRAGLALLAIILLIHGCSESPTAPGNGGDVDTIGQVIAEPLGISGIRLKWKAASPERVVAYRVERRVNLQGEFSHVSEVPQPSAGDTVYWVDSQVLPDSTYGYRVLSIGARGEMSLPSPVVGAATPPAPGLRATVVTEAVNPEYADQDGYTIEIAGAENRNAVVASNDMRLFTPLEAGPYTVSLRGIREGCSVATAILGSGGSQNTIPVVEGRIEVVISDEGLQTITELRLAVVCRDPTKGEIRVVVTTAGDTTDADGFEVKLSNPHSESPSLTVTARSQFQASDSVSFRDQEPGAYEVELSGLSDECLVRSPAVQAINVEANQVHRVTMTVDCITDENNPNARYYWTNTWIPDQARPGDAVRLRLTVDMDADRSKKLQFVQGILQYDSTVVKLNRSAEGSNQGVEAVDPSFITSVTSNITEAAGGQQISFLALSDGEGRPGVLDIVDLHFTVVGEIGLSARTTTLRVPNFSTLIGYSDGVTEGNQLPQDSIRIVEDVLEVSTETGPPPDNSLPIVQANGPYTGTVGTPVTFNSTGTRDPDGDQIAYRWEFGDGAQASAPSPTHTYSAPGDYTARLTVTDARGATGSATAAVSITPGQAEPAPVQSPYLYRLGWDPATAKTDSTAVLTVVTRPRTRPNDVTFQIGYDPAVVEVDSVQRPLYWDSTYNPNTSAANRVVISATRKVGSTRADSAIVARIFFKVIGASGDSTLTSTAVNLLRASGAAISDTTGLARAEATLKVAGIPNQSPIAEVGGPYTGTVSQPVSFTSDGSSDTDGQITSYAWTFGDGTTSTESAPQHSYNAVGTYQVKLTVTDNGGATASDSTTATITSIPNRPPIADAGGPYTGTQGNPIRFVADRSSDPDGDPLQYIWTFGDGASAQGDTVHHTYPYVGTYLATLTVSDTEGATNDSQATVTVNPAQPNAIPIARPGGPYSAMAAAPLTFNGLKSGDADGRVVGYEWDFGDGATATGPTPTHAYEMPGTHPVRLTVVDDRGARSAQAPVTATISSASGGAFAFRNEFVPSNPDAGEIVVLQITARPGLSIRDYNATITWNPAVIRLDSIPRPEFWDASWVATPRSGVLEVEGSRTASAPNGPLLTPLVAKAYFTVVGSSGQSTTTQTSVGITGITGGIIDTGAMPGMEGALTVGSGAPPTNTLPIPIPSGPYAAEPGQTISFDGRGSLDADGQIVSYSWDFGNGATGTGAAPQYAYSAVGNYTVSLTVRDDDGGTATATTTALIRRLDNDSPMADAGGPYTAAVGNSVTVTAAASSDNNGVASYAWDLNQDGSFDDGSSVTATYTCTSAGAKSVSVRVTDASGNVDVDGATVNCTASDTTPPTVSAGGPYSGMVGGDAVALTGTATDNVGVTSTSWDLDNDGQFNDGPAAAVSFTCTTTGSATVRFRARDAAGNEATAQATVTCGGDGDTTPPVARFVGAPYSGPIGGTVQLNGTASTDNEGVTSYAWDFDDDGSFTDASGAQPVYSCAVAGQNSIRLRVADAAGNTNVASTTVTCTSGPPPNSSGTISSRWVNASGQVVNSVSVGSQVFLEIDAQAADGREMGVIQADVLYDASLLSATGAVDLACGAGASCPSATPVPAGNQDQLNQLTQNAAEAGRVRMLQLNTALDPSLGAIHGFARITFTASATGSVTPSLTLIAVGDTAGNPYEGDSAVFVESIPTLTVQ